MSNPSRLSHDWFPMPLPANVVVGERSWCYSAFAFLHYRSRRPRGVEIGHDTGVYNGTFFDLGPAGEVKVGNYCSLVGAIISTNGRVVIGDYTFIAHEVVLADSPAAVPPTSEEQAADGPADVSAAAAAAVVSIAIGENCWIGARAILLRGARIGDGAVIGAGAVVDFEVPPGAIVAGNPATVVGTAGLSRRIASAGRTRPTADPHG